MGNSTNNKGMLNDTRGSSMGVGSLRGSSMGFGKSD